MPAPNAGVPDTSVNSGVKEYLFAKLNTQQAADLTTSDHVKFDTLIASRTPSGSISLDITTAYVNTNGTASIGRLTLKAGRAYHLRASVPYILGSGATGALRLAFYDVTSTPAALPGTALQLLVATTATNDIGGGVAEAVFTPTVDSLVELRIEAVTALTRIGTTTSQPVSLFVESDI